MVGFDNPKRLPSFSATREQQRDACGATEGALLSGNQIGWLGKKLNTAQQGGVLP
jgi:hypothetical protein